MVTRVGGRAATGIVTRIATTPQDDGIAEVNLAVKQLDNVTRAKWLGEPPRRPSRSRPCPALVESVSCPSNGAENRPALDRQPPVVRSVGSRESATV
jgi:hypothetical protein